MSVRIVEVGPRDGLQNEPERIPLPVKLEYIRKLAAAGLRHIEATSFVHPKWVPQLADAGELVAALDLGGPVEYSVLVPNLKGLERALSSGVRRVAIFAAASEEFSRRNLNRSIHETLGEYAEVVRRALAGGLTVRGYVSTCFGCPYQGAVEPDAVRRVTEALLAMGVDEVSLGDTIGVAVPPDVERVLRGLPVDRLALHMHDTSGTALVNVWAGLQLGVGCFDSSSGGLGGCPYAPGAAGNLATEDLVYLLERSGHPTGVDLERLADASLYLAEALGRELPSRQLRRLRAGRG
ncbi:MAG: hydroxymethylglutaryl-CoA lyase [Candidatus Eremiobacterota bacterium]